MARNPYEWAESATVEEIGQTIEALETDLAYMNMVVEIALKIDAGEIVNVPQPHHKLWSIIAGNRQSLRDFAEEILMLREKIANKEIT